MDAKDVNTINRAMKANGTAKAKAKPAKPMTEKDMQTLHKVVKANGKAKAKEKAKDDKKK